MGYTHYWRKRPELSAKAWHEFTVDVNLILKRTEAKLAWEYDELGRAPEVTKDLVRFNGVGADGHETFHFDRTTTEEVDNAGLVFAFCKTAVKPYDEVVCAVLIAASDRFGGAVRVSSDGDWADWAAGRKLYEAAVRRPAACPFAEGE